MRKRILYSLLFIFVLTGLTACGSGEGVKVNSANALAKKLASDSTVKINIAKDIVLEEPIIVNGEKELVGSGKITAAIEDGEELYMFTVADGGKLTIGDAVKLDASGMSGGIHVKEKGKAVVKEKAVVKNASKETANVLSEGSFEIKGGKLEGAKGHNIHNKKETVISGGEIIGSGEKYAGIYNEGTLTQNGGSVSKAYNNVSNVKGSSFTFEGGSNAESARDGVFVAEGASMKATKKEAVIENADGRGILLQGQADIKVITVKDCGDTLIKVGKTGVLNLGNGILQEGNYHGVDNAGTMNMMGGTIQMNTNCGIVNTGTLKVTAGTIANNANKGILNKHEGKADVTSAMVNLTSNKIAIGNEDKAVFEFAKAKILMSTQTNIFCYDGTMNIHDASLNASTSNNVRITDGTINMKKVEVGGNSQKSNTSHHGIYMEGGTINAEDVTIKMTTGSGIRNKGGVFKGKNIVMHDINRVAVSQGKHDYLKVEGLTEINGLEIQSTNYANVWNEGGGTVKITNAKFAVAASNSVRVNDGLVELTNVTIPGHKEGLKNNIHGIYMEGGELVAQNMTISNTAGNGIRNKNGKFVGKNITINNVKGDTAIANLPLDEEHKDGIIDIDTITIRDSFSKNVTLDSGVTTLRNATLGKAGGNNIKMQSNAATLNLYNVKLEGQREDAVVSTHGIMVEGGNVNGENVQISDTNASGVRCKLGSVNLKNVTITNTGQSGISSGNMVKDTLTVGSGHITINGLTVAKAGSNNVLVEAGNVILKNARLGKIETDNHNVKVTGKGSLILDEAQIEGTVSNSKYGVIVEGGNAVLNNVEMYDIVRSAIHGNRATSDIKGTNVTVRDTSMAVTGSNGKIKINGLVTSNIKENNVSVTGDMNLTLKNSTLSATTGHNVKATERSYVTLEDTTVEGVTAKAPGDKRAIMAEGGSFKLTDVTVTGTTKTEAIYANKADSRVTGRNVTVIDSNNAVSCSNGTITIDNLVTEGIKNNNVLVRDKGQVTVKNSEVSVSAGHNMKAEGGLLTLNNVKILGVKDSSKHVLMAEGGNFDLTKVEITGGKNAAIRINKNASRIKGKQVTIAGSVNGVSGSDGKVTINGLYTSDVTGNNILAEGKADITVTSGKLGKTSASHSVKATGTSVVTLKEIKINGCTSKSHYGVIAEGGSINLTKVEITDVKNAAIRINKASSTVTGKDLKVKECENGISNLNGTVAIENFEAAGVSGYGIRTNKTVQLAGIVKSKIYMEEAVALTAAKALTGSLITIEWAEGKLPVDMVAMRFVNEEDAKVSKGSIQFGEAAGEKYVPYYTGTQVLLADKSYVQLTVTNYAELVRALTDMKENNITSAMITLAGDIVVEDKLVIEAGKEVRLIDNGTVRTIRRSENYTSGDLFQIEAGARLAMTSTSNSNKKITLKIDGGSANEIPVITGRDSSFVRNQGTVSVGSGVQFANAKGSEEYCKALAIYADTNSVTEFKGVLKSIKGQYEDGRGIAVTIVKVQDFVIEDAWIEENYTPGEGIIRLEAGGSLTIRNSVFKDNESVKEGGVLSESGNAENKLVIENSEFTGNKTAGNGGVVTLHCQTKDNITITGTTFKENTAAQGAAINLDTGASISLTDCEFKDNKTTAQNKAETNCGYGDIWLGDNSKAGGIYISGKMIADIYMNQAGVVNVVGELTEGSDVVANWRLGKIIGESFIGIHYASADVMNASREYISLSKNYNDLYVIQNAGITGILVKPIAVKSETELRDMITAISQSEDKAGILKVTENFTISNTVTIPAGVDVTIVDDGTARTMKRAVKNITMFDVKADAVFTLQGSSRDNQKPKLFLDGNSTSITNSNGASLINVSGKAYVGEGAVLTNNKSTGNNQGFAIYSQAGSKTTFCGVVSNIEGTHASVKGNVFVVKGVFTLKNAIVKDNIAVASAPIRVQGGQLTAIDTTFRGNQSTKGNAGAIYTDSTAGSSLLIDGCTFEGNTASASGGAISIENVFDANTIRNTKFTGNQAKAGGAVNMVTKAYLNLENCEFSGNVTTNTATTDSKCGYGDIRLGDNAAGGAIRISGKIIADIYMNQAGKLQVTGALTEGSKVIANWRIGKITGNSWTGITFADTGVMEASKTYLELSNNYKDTYELSFSGASGILKKK